MNNFFWSIFAGILDGADNIPKTITQDNANAKVSTILAIVFAIAGAAAFLVVTIAGLMMVISSGEPAKVAKARQTIIYALVGLVVSILAFTIVKFVVGRV